MKTVETSPMEDRLARKQLMRRRISSLLMCLSLASFLTDLALPNFVRAGRPPSHFAGFGMVVALFLVSVTCLVRAPWRFWLATGVLGIGVSFGLALELVRFPAELEGRGGRSPTNWCITNLKQIEGAKANWALEERKTTNDTPRAADLYGMDRYIRVEPMCPRHGVYLIGRVGVPPRCSFAGHSMD